MLNQFTSLFKPRSTKRVILLNVPTFWLEDFFRSLNELKRDFNTWKVSFDPLVKKAPTKSQGYYVNVAEVQEMLKQFKVLESRVITTTSVLVPNIGIYIRDYMESNTKPKVYSEVPYEFLYGDGIVDRAARFDGAFGAFKLILPVTLKVPAGVVTPERTQNHLSFAEKDKLLALYDHMVRHLDLLLVQREIYTRFVARQNPHGPVDAFRGK